MVYSFRVAGLASLALKNETNYVREIDPSCSINTSGVISQINSALWMEGHKKESSMIGTHWGSLPVVSFMAGIYFCGTGHETICKQKSQKTQVMLKVSTAKPFFYTKGSSADGQL